jgi:hypothetical protein
MAVTANNINAIAVEFGNLEGLENPNALGSYRNRLYYTEASSPNFLFFPATNLGIGQFYGASPNDEWAGDGGDLPGGDGGK